MRRDETPSETSMEHLDEGTVHAWLDGALPADEAARLESHVAECPACAELVAEARGLIAGASRIVGALDEVPGGVIPAAVPASEPVVPIATARPPVARPRRWALRAAAAFAVMVGGTTLVMRSASRPAVTPARYEVAHSVAAAPGPSDVRAEPEQPPVSPMMAPAAPPLAAADSVAASAPSAPATARSSAAPPPMLSARRALEKVATKAPPSAEARDTVASAGAASAPLNQGVPNASPAPAPSSAEPSQVRTRARASVADAADRTRVVSVAGCYALEHGATAGWPARVELQSVGARSGYAVRVPSPATDSAYWAALPGDSVRVVWFARDGAVEARLGPAGDGTLRGTARPLTTAGAPRPLVARRVACEPR